jgi:SPP1 gp7 family putative phage head morphogenesis protein
LWPAWAWQVDQRTATYWADHLVADIDIDAHELARAWVAAQGQKALLGTAVAWLKRRALGLAEPIGRTVLGALVDGWRIGTGASEEAAGVEQSTSTDWSRWKPGEPTTDAGKDLQRLLDDAKVTIKSIEANRIDDLAKVLADGLDAGGDVDEIANKIRPLLKDPQWARRIAVTETSRAIAAAAHATYSQYGITKMSWATAGDEKTCAVCLANEAAGLIGIDDRFPSGDQYPPGHTSCRCALVPSEP